MDYMGIDPFTGEEVFPDRHLRDRKTLGRNACRLSLRESMFRRGAKGDRSGHSLLRSS